MPNGAESFVDFRFHLPGEIIEIIETVRTSCKRQINVNWPATNERMNSRTLQFSRTNGETRRPGSNRPSVSLKRRCVFIKATIVPPTHPDL